MLGGVLKKCLMILLVVVVAIPVFSGVGYVLQRTLIQRSLGAGPLATLLVTFGLSIVL